MCNNINIIINISICISTHICINTNVSIRECCPQEREAFGTCPKIDRSIATRINDRAIRGGGGAGNHNPGPVHPSVFCNWLCW